MHLQPFSIVRCPLNLRFHPGRILRIANEPIGCLKLILSVGRGVDVGCDALQGLLQSSRPPDQPSGSGDRPNGEKNQDGCGAERNNKVEELETDGHSHRHRQSSGGFLQNPVAARPPFDLFK